MIRTTATIATLVFATALAGCLQDSSQAALARASAAGSWEPSSTAPSAVGDTNIVLRRMYEGPSPDFWGTSSSPDGRYVTQTDWSTGDLAILDLLTGAMRRVTRKKDDEWVSSYAYSEMARFSPDGRHIAYAWYTEPGHYELRVTDMDHANVRTLWTGERTTHDERSVIWWPDLHGWAPDGRHLLATLYPHETGGREWRESRGYLTLVSVEDGAARTVHVFPPNAGPALAAVSPDGRWVAFEDDMSPSSPSNGDISVIDLDGGAPVEVVGGPSIERVIGWLPDGSLLFYSDRELTEGVWRLPMAIGRPAGEPELVRGDVWRMEPIGLSRDALYYGVRTQRPQIFVAGVDLSVGRIISPPMPIEEPTSRQVRAFDWSPDGAQLAYVSHDVAADRDYLVIRSVSGEEGREMPLQAFSANNWIRWTPDGASIFLNGRDLETGESGVHRLDLRRGTVEPLREPDAPGDSSVYFLEDSPDRKRAFVVRWSGEDSTHTLVARERATGEEIELHVWSDRPRYPQMLTNGWLSPDGSQFAFFDRDFNARVKHLLVVPTAGGPPLEVWSRGWSEAHPLMGDCGGVQWSPDGHFLLFDEAKPRTRGETPDPRPCQLLMVPATGGEVTVLGELPLHRGGFGLHPDGNRIAFRSGEDRGEIWRMENLPGMQVTRR
jgi:Tol biopolymer transport system component